MMVPGETDAQRYRRNAATCRKQAAASPSGAARAHWLSIAVEYESLAALADQADTFGRHDSF